MRIVIESRTEFEVDLALLKQNHPREWEAALDGRPADIGDDKDRREVVWAFLNGFAATYASDDFDTLDGVTNVWEEDEDWQWQSNDEMTSEDLFHVEDETPEPPQKERLFE